MSTTSSHRLSAASSRAAQARRIVVAHVQQTEGVDDCRADAELLARHPELLPELQAELKRLQRIRSALLDADQQCLLAALDRLDADAREEDGAVGSTRDVPNESGPRAAGATRPDNIGRYRVIDVLGEGGFGRVYLGRDDQLQRDVAIKMPWPGRIRSAADMEIYLAEARTVALLDHPSIVPVFDVGHTDDGLGYVVSKRIAGRNLAACLQQQPMPLDQALQILTELADALAHAHARGLVHRDIKPANILLDGDGHVHLVDFGLAIHAGEILDADRFAGTPAYMSPEQARGEGHRIDGRSDVFSLGVVFYEMLTGRKPFRGMTHAELLEQIKWHTPPAPSRWDEHIPVELDRICLRMLAKRSADRYADMSQLINDLRALPLGHPGPTRVAAGDSTAGSQSATADGHPLGAAHMVPKGLRAFDAEDADWFLALLPGPCDRSGLPDSVRQWKTHIESRDPTTTFPVGLMYGPSGCGKSSLVRAGLLPRLEPTIHTIYMEACGEDVERRLLQRVQRYLNAPEPADDLAAYLAAVRRGEHLDRGEKILIVLDQFEQWLHGKDDQQRRQLATALRQCDGVRLQCLLLVRDDFWLAIGRFMNELEIDLVQGHNVALVDLFDTDHARGVLQQFGHAYNRFSAHPDHLSNDQATFLQRAIHAIADQGRVVPVRLALFAEMTKDRPWTPTTLKSIGGAEGVGVAFLETMFSAGAANPEHRLHQRAARAVLASLLPDAGQNIRGRFRSVEELLDTSGYGMAPRKFNQLMRILDAETRLLTPIDPEAAGVPPDDVTPGRRYFQLTHDYLVPSLRQWLHDKQSTTRRGRATLRLQRRTELWTAQPERRQLPSLMEWIAIRFLTPARRWTAAQQRMMRAAARYYAMITLVMATLAVMTLYSGVEIAATARNLFWKVRARSAAVGLAVGLDDSVWPMLNQDVDPAIRTQLIHQFKPWSAQPEDVLERFSREDDPAIRRALMLVVGQLVGGREDQTERSTELRRAAPIIADLVRVYQVDPDSGVHSALRWTLQRYEQDVERLDRELRAPPPRADRQWFVNSTGDTMVVIPGPAYFATESAGSGAPGERHFARLPRAFAIASREVSVGQFQRFVQDTPALSGGRPSTDRRTESLPQGGVSWYAAAAYCNWLSRRERIPQDQWCYQPNDTGQYGPGMRIVTDAQNRSGYRLPTELEWEYACRGGTTTARFTGDGTTWLDQYAACRPGSAGSPLPTGTLKPNDFGLFDMLGNIAEWCHNAAALASTAASADAVGNAQQRVARGGSYLDAANVVRCATRFALAPNQARPNVGFRVARTYP